MGAGGFKIFTHDFRPPIQGGDPVWAPNLGLPYELPTVRLDTSKVGCAAGWNYVTDLAEGFRIAGLWSHGRTAAVFAVEPSADAVERRGKWRCSQLTLLRKATRAEIEEAVRRLSEPFGEHVDRMCRSQLAWFDALGSTRRDPGRVEAGLRTALKRRGLDWQTKRYPSGGDAWAAWAAWNARDARAAWAAWAAGDARDAWAAWDAGDAWAAWDAWAARAAWAAWAARAARDARDALTVEYAALRGWTDHPPDLLARGILTAYKHGLAVAVPTGPGVLGWAMRETEED